MHLTFVSQNTVAPLAAPRYQPSHLHSRPQPVGRIDIGTGRSYSSLGVFAAAAAGVLSLRGDGNRRKRNHGSHRVVAQIAHRDDAASQQPTLPALTKDDLRQLKFDVAVNRQDRTGAKGSGFVVMDVNAPPAVVMDALQNFEVYPEMIKSVRKAKARSCVENADGTTTSLMDYSISRFRLGISVAMTSNPAAGLINFGLDPEKGRLVLEEASGFWFVEEAPGNDACRSRVWFCVKVQACKIVPHAVVDIAAKCALTKATSWLKPYVEKSWRRKQVRNCWQQDVAIQSENIELGADHQNENFAQMPRMTRACTA